MPEHTDSRWDVNSCQCWFTCCTPGFLRGWGPVGEQLNINTHRAPPHLSVCDMLNTSRCTWCCLTSSPSWSIRNHVAGAAFDGMKGESCFKKALFSQHTQVMLHLPKELWPVRKTWPPLFKKGRLMGLGNINTSSRWKQNFVTYRFYTVHLCVAVCCRRGVKPYHLWDRFDYRYVTKSTRL